MKESTHFIVDFKVPRKSVKDHPSKRKRLKALSTGSIPFACSSEIAIIQDMKI